MRGLLPLGLGGAALAADSAASEVFYDNILIKFDKHCLTELNLKDYYKQALLQGGGGDGGRGFASAAGGSAGVDPDAFARLLDARLLRTRAQLSIQHSGDDAHDAAILRETRRRRRLQSQSPAASSLHRSLQSVDPADREEEILASLHLLAAARLVGPDKAPSLLDLEERGDLKSFNEFLSATDRVGVTTNQTAPAALTQYEALDFLQMHVVKNSVLKEALHPLAKLLPCLELEPEPDRTKASLSILRGLAEAVAPKVAYDLDPPPLQKNLTSVSSAARKAVFIPPNDPHFDAQWYLKGAAQAERFGSHVIDGWANLIRSAAPDKTTMNFSDLMRYTRGIDVAVLDSGCSRNPDLVNQFWRNRATPGCTAGAFVGSSTDRGGGDCVGYDFGNDQPDPTREIATRIHGSSTSGLIAAEGNNDVGIVGICPNCRIVCLKIYDSEKQRITMTSVVRALDYIGRKNIKLSNHSYGGFGASEIERSAHEALTKLGHLSVCSSGNNACNIDAGAAVAAGDGAPAALDDPKVCRDDAGKLQGPFTPATYDVAGILSIGGTTRRGELAWFSNYGAKSVDVFAPGDSIVTLYGPDQLASVKGTSFSSPIVAGIAAVLWAARPELSNVQVKQLLMSTGIPVRGLQGRAREGRIVSLSRALASDTSYDLLSAAATAGAGASAAGLGALAAIYAAR